MPLSSDVFINAKKFDPEVIGDGIHKFNADLIEIETSGPNWVEVGAAKYRELRWNGLTPFPRPDVIESGINSSLPSREEGRTIPTRIFKPEQGKSKGVFLHTHGGGWVFNSEGSQDKYLKFLADAGPLTVISIGYRLAPEHIYPAAIEDSYDAAEYLVDNAQKDYGVPLLFAGGESAGSHLACLIGLHLQKARPNFAFAGLLLNFGIYNLAQFLPQVYHFPKPLLLDYTIMKQFVDAFLPDSTPASRLSPAISPFYANLRELAKHSEHGLPPALFLCGSEDCLLDDTVMMGVKWQMAGAEAVVKVYPGAPHSFWGMPRKVYMDGGSGDWEGDVREWLAEKMEKEGL